MRGRIALRLLAFFAAALLLLAGITSLLFRTLFTTSLKDAKREEMLARADALSQSLGQALESAPRGAGRGAAQGAMGASYAGYVRLLAASEPNLWVLDENLEFLSTGRMMGRVPEYKALPPDAEEMVREVFEGRVTLSESFSGLVGAPTLTVGAPIRQSGRVVGALLLHDAVAGVQDAVRKGQALLLYSTLAALLLAILLSVLLSYTFTRPISRIKLTAGRLAEGDYDAKTGLARGDEIGELAQSVDTLSVRLLEARLEGQREEQRRKDFLANVSHELRTPVTVLRGSLEALRDGVVRDPGKVEEYYTQMLLETQGLQRLVNDLMELARLQNADFPIQRGELSLRDVFADALRAADRLAQDKGVRLEKEIPDGPVPFFGDYERLRQMLLVALDNAVKFSSPGGRVRARMGGNEITVSDEGPGIPPEELEAVFDRFHKSGSGGDRQGSGLGLAIARQIAQRHGIQIALESVVGRGTTVRFTWAQGGGPAAVS